MLKILPERIRGFFAFYYYHERILFDKYGEKFIGDKLIRVRADSEDLVGIALSSIHIPFIYPQYIESPIDNISFPWYDRHKGSLECFWHLNKILQVKVKK